MGILSISGCLRLSAVCNLGQERKERKKKKNDWLIQTNENFKVIIIGRFYRIVSIDRALELCEPSHEERRGGERDEGWGRAMVSGTLDLLAALVPLPPHPPSNRGLVKTHTRTHTNLGSVKGEVRMILRPCAR